MMIGRGEKVIQLLLEKIFPNAELHVQVHVGRLFNHDRLRAIHHKGYRGFTTCSM